MGAKFERFTTPVKHKKGLTGQAETHGRSRKMKLLGMDSIIDFWGHPG